MQLSLFDEMEGCPPRRPPAQERDVLFYALLLGPQLQVPASRLVSAARDTHGLSGRMRSSDTFHISVLGYGFADELTREELELAATIADDVRIKPFELEFPELLSWGGHKKAGENCPLVLTCSDGRGGILGLAARLTSAMIARGFRPRSFMPQEPHLTLLYDPVRVPKTPVDPPIRVMVDGFSLVHSHRGESRYTVLWPRR
jgi:2'-5' RNA ligase